MRASAISIVKTLRKAGFEAYFAGGVVRDILLKKHPKDIDIATNARPEEIEKLLEKTIPIGKEFGVILAIVDKHHFEIATFRSDSALSDGRRPDAVFFTNAEEDAKRRDFTVNGLFYDPIKKEILDYIGGKQDLKNKIIRFIGNPNQRIKEDYLRILRAVRFKNILNFEYDAETATALQANVEFITKISSERIGEELTKMFVHKNRVQALIDLSKFEILKFILPEIEVLRGVQQPEQYHEEGDVFNHTLAVLRNLPRNPNKALVFSALFHDIGKPATFSHLPNDRIRFNMHAQVGAKMTEKICRRLKFSNLEIDHIAWLVEHHMAILQIFDMRPAHQINFLAHPWFLDLLQLHRADALGSIPVGLSVYYKLKRLYAKYHHKLLLSGDLISGKEIEEYFHLYPSPEIGRLKKALHNAQIDGRLKTKEEAWEFLKKCLPK